MMRRHRRPKSRWWHGALWSVVIAALASPASHAGTPEAKMASTQVTATLAELKTSAGTLKALYLAEIELARVEVGRALVAQAVHQKIDEMTEEDFEKGAIAISREIEEAQKWGRNMVRTARGVKVEKTAGNDAALESLVKTIAEAMRAEAAEFKKADLKEVADELTKAAGDLERERFGPKIDEYLKTIFELNTMKDSISDNLKELEELISVFQVTHSVVHEWVMTDVKLSGDTLANIVTSFAELRKSGDTTDGGQP